MAARDERAARAEVLAAALADFDVFCRSLVVIATKNREQANLRFNPVQRKFNARRTGRDLVLKARQMGFTTLELARDVWKFLSRGERIVIFCQTDKDSTYKRKFTADIERMFTGLEQAGLRIDFGKRAAGVWSIPTRDSFLEIVEAGASEAAAQKKGRGGTYSRIHSTEAAFYEHPEIALNAALEGVPNLPGTEIVFESTANGAGTWFHGRWNDAVAGRSGYTPHFFAWFEDPSYAIALRPGETIAPETEREDELCTRFGVTPAQLKWYRAKVAEKGRQDLVDQEYPSDPERCFLVSGRTFFDREKTDELVKQAREPIRTDWKGELRVWREPVPGRAYVVGADPSEGLGGDPGAAVVRDRATGEHCAVLHGQFPPFSFAEKLIALGRMYCDALLAVERNNHGHAVLLALDALGYRKVYVAADDKPGWLSNSVTRSAALDALEDAHRKGQWSTFCARTVGELRTFIVTATGKAEAARGSHDDLVMSEAILHDVLGRPTAPIRAPAPRPAHTRLGTGRGF